jgi:hypothetical protein
MAGGGRDRRGRVELEQPDRLERSVGRLASSSGVQTAMRRACSFVS